MPRITATVREVEGSTGENIRRVGGVESRAVDAPSQYPGVPVDCGRLDARRLDELALREEDRGWETGVLGCSAFGAQSTEPCLPRRLHCTRIVVHWSPSGKMGEALAGGVQPGIIR